MSAVYRALLAEGDRYLEEAQSKLANAGGRVEGAHVATAHAALASAFYARAALEKPDILTKLASLKPPNVTAAPAADTPPASTPTTEVVASMDRQLAGKKRTPRRTPGAAK